MKFERFPGQLLDTDERFLFTVLEIINYDYLIASLQQLYTGMAADITRAPSDKYTHIRNLNLSEGKHRLPLPNQTKQKHSDQRG